MSRKNLFVTYLLWFFFGWTGIHHFYLGRDNQAFVWWSTWGGFFYIGWIRDLWRIPEYVDDANEELDYMERLKTQMKLRKEPPFNSTRFSGEMFVGFFYGLLMRFALPDFIVDLPIVTCLLVCLSITTGVYIVGNIGRERGPFMKCYFVSIICYFFLSILSGDEPSLMYCSIGAAVTFNYYRQYKPQAKKQRFCMRVTHLSSGGFITIALWCSFFYFNANITFQDGETIYLRDSINHFLKSPAWLDFKTTMWELYEKTDERTWTDRWEEFIKAFDPTGETNAYTTLNIPSTATEAEIKQAYKKLVVKWHPDRYKGKDAEHAQQQFMEIQEAYEILRNRRKKSNLHNYSEERSEF